MSAAYLSLFGPGADRALSARQRQQLAELDYRAAHEEAGLLVFVPPSTEVRSLAQFGVLVGRLFDRSSSGRGPGSVRDLLEGQWGSYVAFVRDPEKPAVLRDPSGAVPCFVSTGPGFKAASDRPDLLADFGFVSGEIDWEFVAQDLAFKRRRGRRTGLIGLEEVAPGELRDATGDAVLAWSPWRFTASGEAFQSEREAAGELRAAVDQSVRDLTQGYDRLVLELSGGLDSSIVAGALRGDKRVSAFNAVSADGEGDERDFASDVARLGEMSLRFHRLEAKATRLPSPGPELRFARPGRLGVLSSLNQALADHARDTRSAAFIGGMGGDSVFFATNSAAPIADRLMRRGPGLGLLRTGLDVAHLNNATLWAAGWRGLKLALKPGLDDDRGADLSFLGPAGPLRGDVHPWMAARPAHGPPGRERHIASIAFMMGFLDGHAQRAGLDQLSPLLAQPVLEAALRTPSWFCVANGRDRAVARAAFADRLPDRVRFRRSKGAIDRFVDEVISENLASLRELLMEGVLVSRGLLDRRALEHTLSGRSALTGERGQRILFLADAELWARSWAQRTHCRSASHLSRLARQR